MTTGAAPPQCRAARAATAAGLATACRRLRDAPRLAADLVANALDLVRRSYSRPAGVAHLRGIFRGGATP